MKGMFGGMFDFNHNGKLDNIEQAADLMAFRNMVKSLEPGGGMTGRDLSELDDDELGAMDWDE